MSLNLKQYLTTLTSPWDFNDYTGVAFGEELRLEILLN